MEAAEYKEFEREAYNQVASAWAANVAGLTAPYSRRLLELMSPMRGDTLLDLACGAGHLAAEAASRFGCRVTGLDISDGMLAEAARTTHGIPGIELRRGDAENLPLFDESFGYVASGLGLMYFPDTAKALAEIRRVLRAGGRAGFVVWALPEKVACLHVAMLSMAEATTPWPIRGFEWLVLRIIEDTIPGKGPSPVRFGRPGKLEKLLDRAGFPSARIEEHTEVWEFESFEAFWSNFVKSTPMQSGPRLNRETVARIRSAMERRSRPYRSASGLHFPMTARLVIVER